MGIYLNPGNENFRITLAGGDMLIRRKCYLL